jgi:hypothetical protein
MAKHYIGLDRGKGQSDIAIDTSTTSKAIELVIDDSKITSKSEVVALIDQIRARIAVESVPPVL